jgi:2'-phosphotransferase
MIGIDMAIGMPGKKGVISGMRTSCEVVVEINLMKAIVEGHLPFFTSENKVVLSPGLPESGSIPPSFFRSVINLKKNELIYSAPFDYICVYDFEA